MKKKIFWILIAAAIPGFSAEVKRKEIATFSLSGEKKLKIVQAEFKKDFECYVLKFSTDTEQNVLSESLFIEKQNGTACSSGNRYAQVFATKDDKNFPANYKYVYFSPKKDDSKDSPNCFSVNISGISFSDPALQNQGVSKGGAAQISKPAAAPCSERYLEWNKKQDDLWYDTGVAGSSRDGRTFIHSLPLVRWPFKQSLPIDSNGEQSCARETVKFLKDIFSNDKGLLEKMYELSETDFYFPNEKIFQITAHHNGTGRPEQNVKPGVKFYLQDGVKRPTVVINLLDIMSLSHSDGWHLPGQQERVCASLDKERLEKALREYMSKQAGH